MIEESLTPALFHNRQSGVFANILLDFITSTESCAKAILWETK